MSRHSRFWLLVVVAVCLGRGAAHSQPSDGKPGLQPAGKTEEIQKLIRQLGDDKFRVREKATEQLAALGRPAVPALRQAARSPDPEIASRAERILSEIQNSLPYLLDGLKEQDSQLRKEAIRGLERRGREAQEALPKLLEALKDPDEQVREAAIGAVLAIDPTNPAIANVVPAKAHVDGKYTTLLRRLHIPTDRASYSEFRDYGYYQACDWAGYTNIPAGYWVYVYPYWYIWKEPAKK